MRLSKYLIFTLFMGFIFPTFGEVIDFEPKIQEVTLYPDRAWVERVSTIKLEPGLHQLIFKQGSPNLDPRSILPVLKSDSVTFVGMKSYIDRLPATESEKIRALEANLETLYAQRGRHESSINRFDWLQTQLDRFGSLLSLSFSKSSEKGTTNPKTQAAWSNSFGFLHVKRNEYSESSRKESVSLAKVNEQIQIAETQLYSLRAENAKSRRVVELTLRSKGGNASIGFSYFVPDASWKPSYSIALTKKGVEIVMMANVTQRTGEDWNISKLNLSGASPDQGASAPKLRPIVVRARVAQTTTEFFEEQEESKTEAERPADEARITDSQKDDRFRFSIKLNEPIPSSSQNKRVVMAELVKQPEVMEYRIHAPESRAFYTATLRNKEEFPWLAGPADMYRLSGFIGRSSMEYTPIGSSSLFSFGPDRTLETKRSVFTYRETKGVLSSKKAFRTEIVLSITNRGSETKKVAVFDRLPVSETEEIEVEKLEKTSANWKTDRPGILRADVELKPGASIVLNLAYKITLPSSYPGEIFGN